MADNGKYHTIDSEVIGAEDVFCEPDAIIWCQSLPALGIAVELGPDQIGRAHV